MAEFTLQPLLDLLNERADEAARQLGRLIAAEQDARARLALLCQYREEYAHRFCEAQTAGLTLSSWRNYQEFLGKIDEAIRQQDALVENSAQNTAAGQEHWRKQHIRMKAIDTLSIRHRSAEEKKALRQEQKQTDEFGLRRRTHSLNLVKSNQ
ncbi:MAG: flagellar export protein FliJ [Zoogloeaceae bacterium]|jgi:flagellar FliJ protein|nr:flagellar export protein FliJ [Zoogloeaceae bacterium]